MSNMSNEEVGAYFKKQIDKESSEKIKQLRDEMNKMRTDEHDRYQRELELEKQEIVSNKTNDLNYEYRELLSDEQHSLDRKVMEKRNALLEELFFELQQKTLKFTYSEEYKEWFKKHLKLYKLNDFLSIEVNNRDRELAPKSLECIINDDIVGGFILNDKTKKIFIDETIMFKLSVAKENFYNNSKWFLKVK